jgi:hypothetical protein
MGCTGTSLLAGKRVGCMSNVGMILWQIKPDASKNDLEPKAADLYNRRDVRGA